VKQFSLPVRIGLVAALAGIILVIIGILRGAVPAQPLNMLVALLLGGGVWFLVAWAVASAAVDVEHDGQDKPT
jgi:arginine exporter protein ArgO